MQRHNTLQMQTGRIAGNPKGQSAAEPLTVQRKVQRLGGWAASRPVKRHSTRPARQRDEIVRKVFAPNEESGCKDAPLQNAVPRGIRATFDNQGIMQP